MRGKGPFRPGRLICSVKLIDLPSDTDGAGQGRWRVPLGLVYDAQLLSSTVTDNQNHTVTMVTNTYDGGSLTAVSGTPAGFDAATYTTAYHIRGNVTQKVVPGATMSYTYDVTGHALTGADATGTGATLTYSARTNFAAPGTAAPTAGNPDVQSVLRERPDHLRRPADV
jgi:hypothetical protein